MRCDSKQPIRFERPLVAWRLCRRLGHRALVHLFQSLDVACQHVRGLNTPFVNGDAFENRLA